MDSAHGARRDRASGGGGGLHGRGDSVKGIRGAVLVFIHESQLTLDSFFAFESVTVKLQGETWVFPFLVNATPTS